MQESDQGPQQEPQGQGPEATAIAEQARKAASAGGAAGAGGDSLAALKEAITAADPDERSAAAKELSDEQPAYQVLHRALTEMGIEPEEARNETAG